VFINDILQPTHLLFILVVALLVLGPKRLPEAGRALGKGIRDFRSAIGGDEDRHTAVPTDVAASPTPAAMVTPAEPAPSPVAEPTQAATERVEPAETVHPVG
jgi:sec-independent protein translocase protein TatA